MKQDKIFENTQKATQIPLEFTKSVIDQSKKIRHPSAKVDKIGTVIGGCAGIGLLALGAVELLTGKSLWAVGTLSTGAITIISNRYHEKRKKYKNKDYQA